MGSARFTSQPPSLPLSLPLPLPSIPCPPVTRVPPSLPPSGGPLAPPHPLAPPQPPSIIRNGIRMTLSDVSMRLFIFPGIGPGPSPPEAVTGAAPALDARWRAGARGVDTRLIRPTSAVIAIISLQKSERIFYPSAFSLRGRFDLSPGQSALILS